MRTLLILSVFACATLFAQLSHAAVYPRTGWEAELIEVHHGVSGTVTIVDEDTLRVDNFIFDGGGIDVYFYLGASDTSPAFTSGLEIGYDLFGTPYDGTEGPMFIDLPAATTLDGYNAISVWCTAVPISFGSGTFAAPVPEPSTFALATLGLLSLGFIGWRRRRR